jgi:hypothetical protein
MAEKIAEVHPSWKSLITSFERDGEDCLSEIKVGKNRFGKIKSQKIFQYLNPTEEKDPILSSITTEQSNVEKKPKLEITMKKK